MLKKRITKKVIILLLSLSVSTTLFACNQRQNDSTVSPELPTKSTSSETITTDNTELSIEEQTGGKTVKLKKEYYMHILNNEIEYDTEGKAICKKDFEKGNDGNIIETAVTMYEYNKQGDKTRAFTSKNNDVTQETLYEYEYDSDGNVITKYETTSEYYSGELGFSIELKSVYVYNDDGKVASAYDGTKDDTPNSQTHYNYEYDDSGRLIKLQSTSSISTTIQEYEYDSNDNLIQKTQLGDNGNPKYVYTYTYNSNGDCIKETKTRYDDNGAEVDTETVAEYEYEYY